MEHRANPINVMIGVTKHFIRDDEIRGKPLVDEFFHAWGIFSLTMITNHIEIESHKGDHVIWSAYGGPAWARSCADV